MSDDAIITTHGPDRRNRRCLCATCGEVTICTSAADFFTRGPGHPLIGEPLYCQGCFYDWCRAMLRPAN